MATAINEISGLCWRDNWRISNGKDSYVVPFPTMNPVNLVFHGESRFDYGHFGIHLGQEDRLTFLGAHDHKITAHFIDCRQNSPTFHHRVTEQFYPTSRKQLCVPPGVAHAFDGLEGIFTLNNYLLFLPEPEKWILGETEWNIENDVINIPTDISDRQLPGFAPNNWEASEFYYSLIAEHQRNTIPLLMHEYPYTEDVILDTGESVRLVFRKELGKGRTFVEEWETIHDIIGAGWKRHLTVWSGEQSGFVPLLDPHPFYIVDHGEDNYSHDAYGIHLGQEDHLTFLGPSKQRVLVELVDCRRHSDTFHRRVTFEFNPNAMRFLVIPPGVAHRFQHLENVFTINRPTIFADSEDEYEPSNDVIDWPINKQSFPAFEVSSRPASRDFYLRQVTAQKELLATPPMHATPMILLTNDNQGRPIKVSLRKILSHG